MTLTTTSATLHRLHCNLRSTVEACTDHSYTSVVAIVAINYYMVYNEQLEGSGEVSMDRSEHQDPIKTNEVSQ